VRATSWNRRSDAPNRTLATIPAAGARGEVSRAHVASAITIGIGGSFVGSGGGTLSTTGGSGGSGGVDTTAGDGSGSATGGNGGNGGDGV
jgi:hypothetical protein